MLPGKKEMLARVLSYVRLPAARLRLAPRPARLTVLAYHRVFDLGDEAEFPYDPELVSATPADFSWQMEFVCRHFNLITFETLVAYQEGRSRLPKCPAIVTFDDGHLDNYEVAFPILKQLGVPATIFLSTGYVGCGGTFWFDRVAHLLYRAREGTLEIGDIDFSAELRDVASRRQAAERLLGTLKRVRNEERLAALGKLEQFLSSKTGPDATGSAVVNWDQVREMSRAGIEFGSHSVTHPILTALPDETLDRELRESKQAIELQTGKPCDVFAYPVGSGAFDARVLEATRRCGYKLGISYASGTNPLGGFDAYAIRRLHVERYTTRAYFQSVLAMPGVFG